MTIAKFSRTKSYIDDATVDGTAVTLYTCPANCRSHMSLLYIGNSGTAASNIAVSWYRAEQDETHQIIAGKNLVVGSYNQWDGAFIVLEAGDQIKFTPSATGGGASPHIDCFCTVEEFFVPVGG
jgi:hypothetical protein